jgi:hypothetical protein
MKSLAVLLAIIGPLSVSSAFADGQRSVQDILRNFAKNEGLYLALGCDGPMGSYENKIVLKVDPSLARVIFTVSTKIGNSPEYISDFSYSDFNIKKKWVKDESTNFWLTSIETAVTDDSVTWTAINYNGPNWFFRGSVVDVHRDTYSVKSRELKVTYEGEGSSSTCRFILSNQ